MLQNRFHINYTTPRRPACQFLFLWHPNTIPSGRHPRHHIRSAENTADLETTLISGRKSTWLSLAGRDENIKGFGRPRLAGIEIY